MARHLGAISALGALVALANALAWHVLGWAPGTGLGPLVVRLAEETFIGNVVAYAVLATGCNAPTYVHELRGAEEALRRSQ